MGTRSDVDAAVAAAKAAFPSWARTTREERIGVLNRILQVFERRLGDFGEAISLEMGAPITLANRAQAGVGIAHLATMLQVLETFEFEEERGTTKLVFDPVGVCALITPWNWPINQIACKVVPALAAGCTMVLKPSEYSPLSALLWAEVLHEAGVPPGVFNLVNGDGLTAGVALSSHPDVDMVSFTGSTRAGVEVARNAAATVKRVHQELGGKSPCVILEDAPLEAAVRTTVSQCFLNSGQSCNAPTRLLVPAHVLAAVEAIALDAAKNVTVGDPSNPKSELGPVVSKIQFDRVQTLIGKAIAEGAKVVIGGLDRPAGFSKGFYVRPTIFSDVRNDMTIAREEVFGPVLAILPYVDEADALAIANDTPYGLAAYVWSADRDRAIAFGLKIRAGTLNINGAGPDFNAPFGGFKRSGNGREWGIHGLREFLEIKALLGAVA
jgi:aldehyde dehydrogenase (NAD+)